MTRKRFWGALASLLVVAGLGAGTWYQQRIAGGSDDEPRGGPVELSSTAGDFSLEQLDEDQVAVLFFGYTWCPDVCPMSLSVVRQALGELDEAQRRRVVPVLVSVDPERDTLERLEEYVGYFGDSFIGATGSEAELEEVADRYDVVWRKVETSDSAMEYTIDHSSSLYLVDRDGDILRRVLYSPQHHALLSSLRQELEG